MNNVFSADLFFEWIFLPTFFRNIDAKNEDSFSTGVTEVGRVTELIDLPADGILIYVYLFLAVTEDIG
jgi:hypothetical protein